MTGEEEEARRLLHTARVARMATVDPDGRPHVVPIVFVFDGETLYTAVDDKPKAADSRRLKRVRNLEENPQVAILVDEYHEDWDRLAYGLVHGEAARVEEAGERRRAARLLKEKYPQYGETDLARPDRILYRIRIRRAHGWRASE